MSCTIVSNNILSPEVRESVNTAIRNGIGERVGEWNVVVYQALDFPALAIRIEGPKGLRWSWTFFEQEQAPETIQQKINAGIIAQQTQST
jgi:hypothetical protein